MKFEYDDGGRAAAGYQGKTGDCIVRALAIAMELPYQRIYDCVNRVGKWEARHYRKIKKSGNGARTGIRTTSVKKILAKAGWTWTPTMGIGTGCHVHLRAEELPTGRLIVNVSRHLVAVVDGVIHDTYDAQRDGTRCVYGYWKKGE